MAAEQQTHPYKCTIGACHPMRVRKIHRKKKTKNTEFGKAININQWKTMLWLWTFYGYTFIEGAGRECYDMVLNNKAKIQGGCYSQAI